MRETDALRSLFWGHLCPHCRIAGTLGRAHACPRLRLLTCHCAAFLVLSLPTAPHGGGLQSVQHSASRCELASIRLDTSPWWTASGISAVVTSAPLGRLPYPNDSSSRERSISAVSVTCLFISP